ncbi:hypothetical protein MRX96_029213 [Rhipicephalus microplus]
MLRFSFAVGQHCTGTDAHTEKPATPKRQRALADAAKAGFDERAARTATTTAKKSYLPALAARLTADVTSCRKGHVHCAPRSGHLRFPGGEISPNRASSGVDVLAPEIPQKLQAQTALLKSRDALEAACSTVIAAAAAGSLSV